MVVQNVVGVCFMRAAPKSGLVAEVGLGGTLMITSRMLCVCVLLLITFGISKSNMFQFNEKKYCQHVQ